MQHETLYKLGSCKIIIQKQKECELKAGEKYGKIDWSSLDTME